MVENESSVLVWHQVNSRFSFWGPAERIGRAGRRLLLISVLCCSNKFFLFWAALFKIDKIERGNKLLSRKKHFSCLLLSYWWIVMDHTQGVGVNEGQNLLSALKMAFWEGKTGFMVKIQLNSLFLELPFIEQIKMKEAINNSNHCQKKIWFFATNES